MATVGATLPCHRWHNPSLPHNAIDGKTVHPTFAIDGTLNALRRLACARGVPGVAVRARSPWGRWGRGGASRAVAPARRRALLARPNARGRTARAPASPGPQAEPKKPAQPSLPGLTLAPPVRLSLSGLTRTLLVRRSQSRLTLAPPVQASVTRLTLTHPVRRFLPANGQGAALWPSSCVVCGDIHRKSPPIMTHVRNPPAAPRSRPSLSSPGARASLIRSPGRRRANGAVSRRAKSPSASWPAAPIGSALCPVAPIAVWRCVPLRQ
jgi:hypothetical protein